MPDAATHFLELLSAHRPAWMRDAACAEYSHLPWVGDRGTNATPLKAICARCPVAQECAVYAHENGVGGVWAGTTARERRAGPVRRCA